MTEVLQKLRIDINNVKSSQRSQHTEIKKILLDMVDFLERFEPAKDPEEVLKKTPAEIIAEYKETSNDKTVL